MGKDWYRSEVWDPAIEQEFQARLRRTRGTDREQYLLIQAGALAEKRPEVALKLVDQYLALPPGRPSPGAYVVRARALFSLGRTSEGVQAYDAALARERSLPNVVTQTYLELPLTVVRLRLKAFYSHAMEVLNEHRHLPAFPLDHFKWNAAAAVVSSELGDVGAARAFADLAMEAATQTKSGFRNHPKLGLVGEESAWLVKRLDDIRSGAR